MTTAGAIALGLVLGVLLAQRTSREWRTLAALGSAAVAMATTVGLVAGLAAAVTVAIVAPLTYLCRRVFDGRLAAHG